MKQTRRVILSLLCLCVAHSVYAQPLESIDTINALAKSFIEKNTPLDPGDRMEVHLGQAANNLQLTRCSEAIDVSVPANSSEQPSTLTMRCTGPEAWQVYVPVSTVIFTKVVVTRQPIPSNEKIEQNMLTTAEMDKNQLFLGYYKEMKDVVGLVSTNGIASGSVINKRNATQPILIKRNQGVSIVAIKGSIMVRADGIAREDGALNNSIKVFNPSSKRVLDAIVINSSTVQVL